MDVYIWLQRHLQWSFNHNCKTAKFSNINTEKTLSNV